MENFEQAIMLVNCGEEHRSYKETSIHEHSSRSHTIFQIFIESTKNGDSRRTTKYSCLYMVDLAGSERLNEYVPKSESSGETGFINKSLFVISNVINRLAEGKGGHIPYRDSKLTRILSLALGGNSLTAIICTISPALMNFHQTLSTLRFATRAKIVENHPKVNEFGNEPSCPPELKNELNKLREEVKRLERENRLLKQNDFKNVNKQVDPLEESQQENSNKECNFVENLVGFIDSIVDAEDSVEIDTQDRNEWSEDKHKLISLYK